MLCVVLTKRPIMPKPPTGKKRGARKGPQPSYTAEEWQSVKVAYESGEYTGFRDIYASYTKTGKKCPTIQAMKQKSVQQKWFKGEKAPEIAEAMHEKYLRIARNIGLTDDFLLEKIKGMIESVDSSEKNNGIQRFYDISGIKAPHKIARTDDDGNAVNETLIVVPANGFEPKSS